MKRRIVVTVCPRELGVVALPLERGGRLEQMDARAIAKHLEALVTRRGLEARVRIQEGCAGGCWGPGPNVSVAILPLPGPGEQPDHIAVGWRTYVASLDALDDLARVIDDNIGDDDVRAHAGRRSSRFQSGKSSARAPRASRTGARNHRTRA